MTNEPSKILNYLSCPYYHPDPKVRSIRLLTVNWVASQMLAKGEFVYSPLSHNVPINMMGINGNWDKWKHFDLHMLSRCDKMLLLKLPGWENSRGVAGELGFAKENNIPIIELDPPEEELKFPVHSMETLLAEMIRFFEVRDWEQYHSPKNLSMDLGSEVGEILDHFRWLTEEESYKIEGKKLQELKHEIGDVFRTLIYLCSKLNIDPVQASYDKLQILAERYPVELSKGKHLKHTEIQIEDRK